MNNPNDKNIVSRIIIQKILSSDSMEFACKNSVKTLNATFLSENPDSNEIRVAYRTLNAVKDGSWHDSIAELCITWSNDGPEIQDLDGNVWMPHRLTFRSTINSMYHLHTSAFKERMECLNRLNDLIIELEGFCSDPIKVMTLNNEQRVTRDTKRKFDASCKFIIELITSDRNSLRRNLRAGGTGRPVDRHRLPHIEPGRYEVEVNDGSKRRPRMRRYAMIVPENSNYLACLKRIS